MQENVSSQLDKVLALADSSHEGEAVGAVRIARQILSRDGLSFSDLARAATKPRFTLPLSLFSSQQAHQEAQLAQMQQKIYDLQGEQQSLQTQVDFWRQRAMGLEQQLNLSLSDAQRWRQLARETIEKLWDTGQAIQQEEFYNPEPAPEAATAKK